ncbi:transporter substrate-binding domain-containing protein [Desulfovibrio sp. Huiquan2017]|uniref:substrate-binding periplasmic protein n=1 Tax=Desulfovibrio sp. Huiquan2017 TaxID=2816861 RepID=UPI001A927242|nr:transporter substrate-binding domain-containing protein [Desulfovibrio sp. Huiquan2017]
MSIKCLTMVILMLLPLNFVHYVSDVCAQDNPIVIAGDMEKEGGYLAEITDAAFRRVGYDPKFIFVPWARALSGTIATEYDVLLAAYQTEERGKVLLYSNPIGTTDVILLKLKTRDIHFSRIEDLRPYRIGHIKGSKVNKEFDEAEKKYLKIDYVKDAQYNIKKLLAGRIDLAVEKKERIEQLLKTAFRDYADRFEFITPPLQKNFFCNCISKKHESSYQIIYDFNRGLRMIQEDGTLDAILERHGAPSE